MVTYYLGKDNYNLRKKEYTTRFILEYSFELLRDTLLIDVPSAEDKVFTIFLKNGFNICSAEMSMYQRSKLTSLGYRY